MNIYQRSPLIEKMRTWVEKHFPWLYDRIKVLHVTFQDYKFKERIRDQVQHYADIDPAPMFTMVEIETINRCNNTCSFCPVNRDAVQRPFKLMEKSLFLSIIAQLQSLNYTGMLSLYSNNEPLLDSRIADFYKIARNRLPKAQLCMFTNASLLTIDRFNELIEFLDVLTINNYDDNLNLTTPVKELIDYVQNRPEYHNKVSIFVQRKNVVRYSRGGQAPNRLQLTRPMKSSCVLPFTQLIIRPDGKVSLCCQDALGKFTLGDLTRETLMDIWNGPAYRSVRDKIIVDRGQLDLCRHCDFFTI